MGLEDNILPDTNVDRERTTAGKWALGIGFCVIVFLTLAFVTPSWLEGDPRIYGTQFEKLGLWVHCFRSLPDYNDIRHERYFAGCRWMFNPFTEGYDRIRSYLAPRKYCNFSIIAISKITNKVSNSRLRLNILYFQRFLWLCNFSSHCASREC